MSGWRRPSWWSVLLTLAAALLFTRLGLWQLDRAAQKEQLLRRYAAAQTAPPEDFAAAVRRGDAFAHVRVRGRFLADRLYLLDNPHHDRRGGVEAYVPLTLPGDQRLLLVDLGFLPREGPDQTPQPPPLPEGEVALVGVYLPPPGVGIEMGGDALARQRRWPKTTVYLDLAEVARDLGRPLYPQVLALDADPASVYVREHAYDFSAMPPARHRAYAFQWFTFAVAVVVILVVVHRPRRSVERIDR